MFSLGFILYSIVFGVILSIVLKKAPLGFEDKLGFHYLQNAESKTDYINRNAA